MYVCIVTSSPDFCSNISDEESGPGLSHDHEIQDEESSSSELVSEEGKHKTSFLKLMHVHVSHSVISLSLQSQIQFQKTIYKAPLVLLTNQM